VHWLGNQGGAVTVNKSFSQRRGLSSKTAEGNLAVGQLGGLLRKRKSAGFGGAKIRGDRPTTVGLDSGKASAPDPGKMQS